MWWKEDFSYVNKSLICNFVIANIYISFFQSIPFSIYRTFEMMFSYSYISRMLCCLTYCCRKYAENLFYLVKIYLLFQKSIFTVLGLYLVCLYDRVDWIFRPWVNLVYAKSIFSYFVTVLKSCLLKCQLIRSKASKKAVAQHLWISCFLCLVHCLRRPGMQPGSKVQSARLTWRHSHHQGYVEQKTLKRVCGEKKVFNL